MVLEGRLIYQGPGLNITTRAMTATMHQMGMHTDNIAHFGVPGYHAKTPVVNSFVEYLGANAIDESISNEIGRIRMSDNPLDMALNTPGYFQKVGEDGRIEVTRDGRMMLNAKGYLLSVDGKHILSTQGLPIKFPFIPNQLKNDVKVSEKGDVTLFDPDSGRQLQIATINVVQPDGTPATTVDMRQGHVEDSNVFLQKEFANLAPLRRQFEANRQLFLIQSDNLSRAIQELGRAQ